MRIAPTEKPEIEQRLVEIGGFVDTADRVHNLLEATEFAYGTHSLQLVDHYITLIRHEIERLDTMNRREIVREKFSRRNT